MQPFWALPLLVAVTLAPLAAADPSDAPAAGIEACSMDVPYGEDQGILWLCVAGQKTYVGCAAPQINCHNLHPQNLVRIKH
ncbi:MAG TPA: hypothetical protein VM241_01665 [Candidatus Thermoplasmatota archaeon]|nr:hypothetical protein [Candidatus Thermoplasmatota archaeon]